MNNKLKEREDDWNHIKKLLDSGELKYKCGNYKGSLDDKRKAIKILEEYSSINNHFTTKYKSYVKKLMDKNTKYDLINDYKLKIDHLKKVEIISSLLKRSNDKYKEGDYKAAARALRRSEKYF